MHGARPSISLPNNLPPPRVIPHVLPLAADRLRLRLRLTSRGRFHFHHGGVVRGVVSAALGSHALPHGVVPVACELGHVRYRPGDPYHLAITFLGDDRRLAPRLVEGLRRLGARRAAGAGPLPALAGNFEIEAVEPLPVPDPGSELVPGLAAGELPLRFIGPLRLERVVDDRLPGAGYLNQEHFPAGHFLSRLWNRLFLVAHGRWPEAGDRAAMPPIPAAAEAEPRGLHWLDVRITGDPSRRTPYTLGGVLGTVVLRGLPADWLPILAAGRLVHAGGHPGYGFGAYEIAGPEPLAGHPLAPARSLLEAAAGHLLAQHRDSEPPDEREPAGAPADPDTPERWQALLRLATALRDGSYRPSPLIGWIGGGERDAIPAAIDHAAQRAARAAIGPSIDALVDDSSDAYRRGLSRDGAAAAARRSRREILRPAPVEALDRAYPRVEWPSLRSRLRALFPFEPLVPLLEQWAEAPILTEAGTLPRRAGLPPQSPISSTLAKLCFDQLDDELRRSGRRLARMGERWVVVEGRSKHAAGTGRGDAGAARQGRSIVQ